MLELIGAAMMDEIITHGQHGRRRRGAAGCGRRECSLAPRRLICVFQPHQHSRTRFLLDQFAHAFTQADLVIVPEIFFVRDSEEERRRISAADLVDRLRSSGTTAMHVHPFAAIVEHLEEVLRERESRPGRPATHRDPDLYWLRVYGTPAEGADWSWRFEGHHIALHVTCRAGALPTVTPFFIGASPLLDARDRDVTVAAFERLRSAADDLLEAIGETAGEMSPGKRPADIRMGPGKWDLPPRDGLDVKGFSESQLAAARALLDRYLELLDEPLRQHSLRPADEDVTFAHWGAASVQIGRAHV